MTIVSLAKSVAAPLQLEQTATEQVQQAGGQIEGLPQGITRLVSFEEVRGVIESNPSPRRPNRCAPIHSCEIAARGAASDDGESAAWAELQKDELTGQEIREIAEHLRSTGEASA